MLMMFHQRMFRPFMSINEWCVQQSQSTYYRVTQFNSISQFDSIMSGNFELVESGHANDSNVNRNEPVYTEKLVTTRQPTFPSEYGYREGNAGMIAITGFVIATMATSLIDLFSPQSSQSSLWIFMMGFGGFCQVYAAAKDFHHGNSLTASIFMLFGFHWIAHGLMAGSLFFIHPTVVTPIDPAVPGCYYIIFTLFEAMLTLCVYLSPSGSWLLFAILAIVLVKLVLSTIHCWWPTPGLLRAGGFFGCLCCLLSMYSFFAESLAEHGTMIPTGKFGGPAISRHAVHQDNKRR